MRGDHPGDHGGHKIRIKNDPRDQYDIFLAWNRFWTGPKWPGSEPTKNTQTIIVSTAEI